MPAKNIFITISILLILAIALFVYPSTNQSVKAEQVKSTAYQNNSISFHTAKDINKTYQRITASAAVIAQYFGKDVVDKILAQTGCVGIRMYYGMQSNGKSGVIIVGFDAAGKDMVSGVLAMPHRPCPPDCGD